jgi:hypothetical protein
MYKIVKKLSCGGEIFKGAVVKAAQSGDYVNGRVAHSVLIVPKLLPRDSYLLRNVRER